MVIPLTNISAYDIAQQLCWTVIKRHFIPACTKCLWYCFIFLWHWWENCLECIEFYGTSLASISPNAPPSITVEYKNEKNEIERYVVFYKKTLLSKVNEARKKMFSGGNRKIEKIPPTKAALQQHVTRPAYQAYTQSHISFSIRLVKQEKWTNIPQAAIV